MAHPYKEQLSDNASKRLSRMTAGYAQSGPAPEKSAKMRLAKVTERGEQQLHGEKAGKFARGGRAKGKTHIAINVMPQGAPPQAQPVPIPVPTPGPMAMPPKPPMAGPMAGPMPGGPGLDMPPGLMRKSGGRAFKNGGAVKEQSIRNGTKLQHAGNKPDIDDLPVIKTRKAGGRISGEDMSMKSLRRAGSESGLGRLDKIKMQKKTYP